jgi:SAM-dependent methyltransferase
MSLAPAETGATTGVTRLSHSVRSHLQLEIAEYDATIRRWIPGYETMIRTAAEAIAAARPTRVVDLGSGTGALAEAILEHEAVGTVELLDIDPEMLTQATGRVARFGTRAVPILRSFDEPFSPCDAFSASLSLHHVPTMEEKSRLFERIFEALPTGGVLVNADATMPADPAEQSVLYAHWADHQVAHGIDREQAFANFEAWAGEDTYMPLDVELAALRAAGFTAERSWNDGPIGVVVARKP